MASVELFGNVVMLIEHIGNGKNNYLDDMLTPSDDEDPMAAIATAPLLDEKDDSMINLILIRNSETVVSHLTNTNLSTVIVLRIA